MFAQSYSLYGGSVVLTIVSHEHRRASIYHCFLGLFFKASASGGIFGAFAALSFALFL